MTILESVSVDGGSTILSPDGRYVYLCPDRYAQLYRDMSLSGYQYFSPSQRRDDVPHRDGCIVYRTGARFPVVYYRHHGVVYFMTVPDFERFVLIYKVDIDRVYAHMLADCYVFPDTTEIGFSRRGRAIVGEMEIGQLRYIGTSDLYQGRDIYAYRAAEGYYFIPQTTLRSFVS